MTAYTEQEFSRRFDWSLWRKLLRYTWGYKKHMIWLAVVMVAVAAIDAVFPLFSKYAIDSFIVPGRTDGIWKLIVGYGAVTLVQALNVWLLIAIAGKIEMGLAYDLREKGFERLQELSLSYYDRTPVGWLMARMTSDNQKLSEIISWGLVDGVWGAVSMAAFAGVMLVLNWKLALIVLLVLPPLVIASGYFQKRILESHRKVRKLNSEISGAYNEGILGARTTKALSREGENLNEFKDLTGRMRRASIRTAIFSALYLPVVLMLGSIGTGLAVWIGGAGVAAGGAVAGGAAGAAGAAAGAAAAAGGTSAGAFGIGLLGQSITYGTLVAFISYTVQFFEPVRELARILTELQSAQAAAERVMSMIETEPEIKDSPEVEARYGTTFAPHREAWEEMGGRVDFEDVTFTYPGGETVLDRFSLSVRAGETVALVGETGSGKTTIVNLACRFYEPTTGRILIDGRDYRERSILWQYSHLGYVLQEPHLFSGTIRSNIRYGRLDATDAEIRAAATLVNAHDLIMRKPGGYDTNVGEGGNLLSTGEKQLISFARAVLANPRIFVLDEATSSIDTESEMRIQEAIQHVLDGRTSFVIAHRLSTVKSADRILVLDKGRIVEEGSHEELLEAGGRYAALYDSQFAVA